jgi:hypothetical protein
VAEDAHGAFHFFAGALGTGHLLGPTQHQLLEGMTATLAAELIDGHSETTEDNGTLTSLILSMG